MSSHDAQFSHFIEETNLQETITRPCFSLPALLLYDYISHTSAPNMIINYLELDYCVKLLRIIFPSPSSVCGHC